MADVDYYEILGVARDATDEEIKKAYRKLARELHPDANGGDKESEERFKLVTTAYETLRDPEKRRVYDAYGVGGMGGMGGGPGDIFGGAGPFGDIFESMFGAAFGNGYRTSRGGTQRGEDMEATVTLSFEEAVFGAQKEVSIRVPTTCSTCGGNGSKPGTTPSICPICQGSGSVKRVAQTILGRMMTTAVCDRCGGAGQIISTPCPDCRGDGRRTLDRSYTVEVPAGVDDGTTLHLTGKGAAGSRGAMPGDLYIHLNVRPDPRFTRSHDEIHSTVHVSYVQAALGVQMQVETLDGPEELTIPGGTQSGRRFVLKGKGVPHLRARGRGDQVVTVVVDVPTELDAEEERLLRELAALRGEEVALHEAGLFSKIKSAFRS
ncbi:MAG: molecular chaperone DnaJ [Actinomycetota bacterium]|nr:molecular chaperone DnaJ [Actinomycetota bacterium]